MPNTILPTAVPSFLQPTAKAGLLPSSRVEQVNRAEPAPAPIRESFSPARAPVPDASATQRPGELTASDRPQPIPVVRATPDLPLQTRQALEAFGRNSAPENTIGSAAIDGIDLFV